MDSQVPQVVAQVTRKAAARLLSGCARGLVLLAAWFWPARGAEFKFLEQIGTVNLFRLDRFVAADAFQLGRKIGGRTLSTVGLNFAEHFLGVVENTIATASLQVWSLQYTMGDASLIRQLGGPERAVVQFVWHIYGLMEMHEGPSHTDGRSNFAYMRSPVDQRLWAVHWSVNFANEWTIGAVYVPHPHMDWRSGSYLLAH